VTEVAHVGAAVTEESRSTPRSAKGERTRARLVAAAKVVFERDGFLDARIVDIAATAEIAPGTYYHYFDSKEEIFREVAQLQEERLTAIPEHELLPGESAMEEIRAGIRLYLERYRDEAALMGVIEQVSRYDEQVREARMATLQHFFEQAELNIRALQRRGVADRRVDAHLAAAALGAMTARFAELWLVQGYGDYDFDDAVEQLSVLCSNSLGLDDDTPAAPRA
jgi:AcrR family transcriptional regulator